MTKPDELWDRDRLKNPHAVADKQKRVQSMFAAIAPSYDLNNRLWSLGIDQRWRKKAVKLSRLKGDDVVVDVACGTGDLSIAYWSALRRLMDRDLPLEDLDPQVIGVDYTYEMLPSAVAKGVRLNPRKVAASPRDAGRGDAYDDSKSTDRPASRGDAATLGGSGRTCLRFLQGDAQALPLPDACCDVVSIAFGIRNVADSTRAYREFRRVLRPGGRVVVLEFSKPTNKLIRWGYDLYFNHVLTRMASLVARDKTGAYRYLASSVETFKPRQQMVSELEQAGFANVTATPLTFGVALIYVGEVPGGPGSTPASDAG